MSVFLFNGQEVTANGSAIDLNSRSYRYGDGFFESMKLSEGRLQHALYHQERINKSLLLLQMSIPESFANSTIEEVVELFCKQKGIENARVRATFLREADGFYQPKNQITQSVIEITEIEYSGYPLNQEGYLLGNYKELTKNGNFTSTLKTTSSLIYVLAGIYAKQNEFDECVIYNDLGNVCEGISSNIFMVSREFIITPPVSEYCVDGVMRKVVIQIAESYGYQVREVPITEIDLSAADEIFFTSATRGIQWVANYMGKPLKCNISRVLSEKL
jgi:branched-chain amino acid aminotransferase